MSAVLTKDSSLKCNHPKPGDVTLGPGAGKLRVKGKPVLRVQDVGPAVSGCLYQHPTPAGAVPCTTVTLTPGNAGKLKVGGVPVLLDTTTGITNSTPAPGTLVVTANQPKLTAK
jgi:hypothetical protein